MLMIENPHVEAHDVLGLLRRAFGEVAAGTAVAPGQFVVDLPGGGDVIHYPGLLSGAAAYSVKVSPYLPQPAGKAVVSAWTLLMSTETGAPLALVAADGLTTERTAATTILAADLLLPATAKTAVVIGYGDMGRAHVRYLRAMRPNMKIRVYSRSHSTAETIDGDVTFTGSAEATAEADIVMLCTSAADDVIDPRRLAGGTVVTSISTNGPGAREIPIAAVPELNVYVDAATTLDVATELMEAAHRGWDPSAVLGTLAQLVAGTARSADPSRVTYFRSVGLGIEDAAVAWAAYRSEQETHA